VILIFQAGNDPLLFLSSTGIVEKQGIMIALKKVENSKLKKFIITYPIHDFLHKSCGIYCTMMKSRVERLFEKTRLAKTPGS
jgi:hypothetical protein